MRDINCRGIDAKRKLVSLYDIKAITRLVLLNGQEVMGCCGRAASDYTLFQGNPLKEGLERIDFVVGYHCARQFADILNISLPKKFNPLIPPSNSNISSVTCRKENEDKNTKTTSTLTPLNHQVYDAIHVLVSAWGGVATGILVDMIVYLQDNPDRDTKEWALKALNRLIAKDKRGRSLTAMIASLRRDNPSLKWMDFDLIDSALIAAGESSNI